MTGGMTVQFTGRCQGCNIQKLKHHALLEPPYEKNKIIALIYEIPNQELPAKQAICISIGTNQITEGQQSFHVKGLFFFVFSL